MGVFLLSGISMFCNFDKKIIDCVNVFIPKLTVRILFENLFNLLGGDSNGFVNKDSTSIVGYSSIKQKATTCSK